MAEILHTPAVPAGESSLFVCPLAGIRKIEPAVVAEEGDGRGAALLLHLEVIVQRHLLHSRHQALSSVDYTKVRQRLRPFVY